MAAPYHVFVYGTLKPGECNYERFCAPYVIEARAAITSGRLYDLPLGYPGMTWELGWVLGVRLTFDDPEVLVQLDQLEEFFPERPPEESEYQRWERPILTVQRQPLGKAWLYLMPLERVRQAGGVWLPAGIWSGQTLP